MNSKEYKRDYASVGRRVAALWDSLATAWAEVRRLNDLGVQSDAQLSRAARAARVRAALDRAYRDRSPCC